ncbi:hypothetical protein NQ318_002725 [Aromia moschata]|uniref:Thioredoxin domain-containing protein n=1 Tax=Aromia moschata TaxID=1265417 RepID=A0AAV8Y6K9_9CUCU|nr:hypothetical protein NQ318_002725 [Aromia moschata]
MQFLLCALSVLSLFSTIYAHEEDVHTAKYDTDNFSDELAKNNHFVMFYAPWCGHCQSLAPTWEQLAEMLNEDNSNLKIAKVDCMKDSKVCSDQEITSYPTLKFYKLGDSKGIRFAGTRDLPSLTTFIRGQLREDEEDIEEVTGPQPVDGLVELTEETFDSYVESGKHFIKFYAPWCGHCQKLAPTWVQLAKSLELEDVSIGKVDCTQHRTVCNNFEVDKYQGGRSHEDLKSYVNKMLGAGKEEQKEEEHGDDTPSPVLELTGETFQGGIQSGYTFVKFYAPWCGHCKRLAPTWDSLGKKFLDRPDVSIVKVDCTLEANKRLCNDEEVEGFPTIYLYKNGQRVSEYSGSRSLDDMYDFINKHMVHEEL